MNDVEVKLGATDINILEDYIFNSQVHYEKHTKRMLGIDEPEGVEIYNKSKLISDIEIERVMDLLHPVYHDLNMSIGIHRSRSHTQMKCLNPFIDLGRRMALVEACKGDLAGLHRDGVITLFPWAHGRQKYLTAAFKGAKKEKREFLKLLIVADLLHEIRHAWQQQHKKRKYRMFDDKYIRAGNKGYHSQWLERDANSFSQRMMNNNKAEINEILGISFEWDCIWGRFKATI